MQLQIAFSPCPNDTFIFDALVHQKIDTAGIDFVPVLEDVETLNRWAIEGKYEISKISYGVYPKIAKDYVILDSGSALGKGVGPLLIASPNLADTNIEDQVIAIPGENTTAHFLFSHAYPNAKRKIFLRYDEIESFVQEGKGLGVIIHENRFTYAQKGLICLSDLGAVWENNTGLSIPLGGIVMKRNLPASVIKKTESLIRQSLEYAYQNNAKLTDYVTRNAQEMEESVMRRHIDLYVNERSLSLGEKGKEAIVKMMQVLGLDVNAIPLFTD